MSSTLKKEAEIKNMPKPVSITGTRTILNQMINCICKIKITEKSGQFEKSGKSGTGFFCKVPLNQNEKINCLITNFHIITEQYYKDQQNKTINLLLNDGEEVKKINIGNDRKIYFNEIYDITIIELKESENFQYLLDLDDNLFKDDENIKYLDKSIYVPQYPKEEKAFVSYGLLNGIFEHEIRHTCSTDNGSSGSPILNLENNKVIGIHKGGSTHFNFNLGTLLKYPINDFIKKNKKNKNDNIIHNNAIFNNNINQFNLINDINNININNNINLINNINFMNNMNNAEDEVYDDVDKPGPKMNVIFTTGYGNRCILIINYGTTIDQMLVKYLKKINKYELYGAKNKIAFIYNVKNLQFGDNTPIEIYFKQRKTPKVQVSFY